MIFTFIVAINTGFYLESDHYVPERTMKKINAVTSAFMTNGIQQFITSFITFRRKLWERFQFIEEDTVENVLTMEELRRPMKWILLLWVLAVVIFFIEIIIFKCRQLFATIMI